MSFEGPGEKSGLCRELYLERRAAFGVRRCRQTAAMRLDDRTADREAHTDAFPLGRVERREQTILRVAGKTLARISHGHADLTLLAPRPHSYRPDVGDILDRIDCIQDQVEQHLLDLHRAALDGW